MIVAFIVGIVVGLVGTLLVLRNNRDKAVEISKDLEN